MPLTIDEQLQAIRRLHVLDTARWAAERELKLTPVLLQEERGAVDAAEAEGGRLAVALKDAQARVRDGERDLSVLQRRCKRAKDRMPYLTSSAQIEATQREVAARTEEADVLEGEILGVMEEVDELEVSLATVGGQLTGLRSALAKRTDAWAGRSGMLEAEVAELSGARDDVVAPLSAELRRLYRAGVKASSVGRREKGGATTVSGMTCDTCWSEVPARWINEILARAKIHSCQTCKRLLLVERDPKPDEEQALSGAP